MSFIPSPTRLPPLIARALDNGFSLKSQKEGGFFNAELFVATEQSATSSLTVELLTWRICPRGSYDPRRFYCPSSCLQALQTCAFSTLVVNCTDGSLTQTTTSSDKYFPTSSFQNGWSLRGLAASTLLRPVSPGTEDFSRLICCGGTGKEARRNISKPSREATPAAYC